MRKVVWFVFLLSLACHRNGAIDRTFQASPELHYVPVPIQEITHSIRFRGMNADRWVFVSGSEVLSWLADTGAVPLSGFLSASWRNVLYASDSLWALRVQGNMEDTVIFPPLSLAATFCEQGVELPLLLGFLPFRPDTWRSPVTLGVEVRFQRNDGWSSWSPATPLGFLHLLNSCFAETELRGVVGRECWFIFPEEEGDSFQIRLRFSGSTGDSFLVGFHWFVHFWRTEGTPQASLTWDTVPVLRGDQPWTIPLRLEFETRICRENPFPISVSVVHNQTTVWETTGTFWIPPQLGDGVLRDPFVWRWTIGEFLLNSGGVWRVEARSPLDTARWIVNRTSAAIELGDTLNVWTFPDSVNPLNWDGTRFWYVSYVSSGDSVWLGWATPGETLHPLINLSRLGLLGIRMVAPDDGGGGIFLGNGNDAASGQKVGVLSPNGNLVGIWDVPADWNRACAFILDALYDVPGERVWGGLVPCWRSASSGNLPQLLVTRMVYAEDRTWEIAVVDSLGSEAFLTSGSTSALYDPDAKVWVVARGTGPYEPSSTVVLLASEWWQELTFPAPWLGMVSRGGGEMEVLFARKEPGQGGTAWLVHASLVLP